MTLDARFEAGSGRRGAARPTLLAGATLPDRPMPRPDETH
jgi:hypothetical protein